MIVDGKSEKNVNTKPTLYENVRVWAAAPVRDYYPTANARIKNLEYNQSVDCTQKGLKKIYSTSEFISVSIYEEQSRLPLPWLLSELLLYLC